MTNINLQSTYIDCHCHLSDSRIAMFRDKFIQNAIEKNIKLFLQGGVDSADWKLQIDLQKKYPQNILTAFGVHPYTVIKNSKEVCSDEMIKLAEEIKYALAVGECGLDFRETLGDIKKEIQLDIFSKHIQIANQYNKVCILHIVQAHDKALELLRKQCLQRKAIVHSFNSNYTTATNYLDLGFLLSIGGPLVRKNNHQLHEVIQKIPLERILIESDTPDQPPPEIRNTWNEPSTILLVAEKIANLKGIMVNKVLEANTKNFSTLFAADL